MLLFRCPGNDPCSPSFKTQSLHWLYEIWTCSFSKVIPLDFYVCVLGMCLFSSLLLNMSVFIYGVCFIIYRDVKYHEPEFWKFGEEGNKYFRHATGQIYAISKDLAAYISINQYVYGFSCSTWLDIFRSMGNSLVFFAAYFCAGITRSTVICYTCSWRNFSNVELSL